MFVPRRMNTDIVRVVVNGVKLQDMTFVPLTPVPFINHTFSLPKMKKSVEDVVVTLILPHAVLENLLDLIFEFVRAFSRSKPFGVSVTGSWSKRA